MCMEPLSFFTKIFNDHPVPSFIATLALAWINSSLPADLPVRGAIDFAVPPYE